MNSPRPRRNIELKARMADLPAAREIARGLATDYLGFEHQVDTYFHVPHGRLKLREIDDRLAQLIAYERPDELNSKGSDYRLVPTAEPRELKAALATTLGVRGVVDKRREIFLVDNVRIHLDEVASLGTFLEFEAVLGPDIDDARGQMQLADLRQRFGIPPEDLIAGSYSDLLGIDSTPRGE